MSLSAERLHVVVIGGGISGLAAAHQLHRLATHRRLPLRVTVLEGSARVGGKLLVSDVAGLPVDAGAEALLNRRPEAVTLARDVGLGDDLRHPEPVGSGIWTRGAVRPMPSTVLGLPVDLPALRTSGILSRPGLRRAWAGALLPALGPRSPEAADAVSVGDCVSRLLGAEVTDRLVEPLLGGVYAGHARQLSLAAAAPQVSALVGSGRPLFLAARERLAQRAASSPEPVFAGIVGGVGRLPQAVAAASGADIRTETMVRELLRPAAGRWQVVAGPTRTPQLLDADAVVLAVPAAPAARLLAGVAAGVAGELRRIPYASVAVVTLAYPVAGLRQRLAGTGFLVPPVDARAVKAATFSSSKWSWLAAAGEAVVVRASLGRHGEEALLQRDDAELVALAVADLAAAVGLPDRLLDARVTRWGGGLPQYLVGHRGRVERIRAAVAEVDGLELCGAAYDGIGVAACVADGQRAAARVVDALAERATMRA